MVVNSDRVDQEGDLVNRDNVVNLANQVRQEWMDPLVWLDRKVHEDSGDLQELVVNLAKLEHLDNKDPKDLKVQEVEVVYLVKVVHKVHLDLLVAVDQQVHRVNVEREERRVRMDSPVP